MIMFQFEVPKSSLYNIAGSKNYDDKIKVFVHDITAQVCTYRTREIITRILYTF